MLKIFKKEAGPVALSNSEANRRLKERALYAATRRDRLVGNWPTNGQTINDILRGDNPVVLGRVRQLVRDFPPFKRAQDAIKNFYVGEGMTFRPRVRNPLWSPGSRQPRFDRKVNQQIEDVIKMWNDQADFQGVMCFHEMERFAIGEEAAAGEFLFLKRRDPDSRRFLPFSLMAYEAEWFDDTVTSIGTGPNGNTVDQGVEYDRFGKITAIHLTDPSNPGVIKTGTAQYRIPIDQVLRGYEVVRAGQLRGVSPFVVGVLAAHSLNDYIGATMDTAKLAAKYLAFVETPDPGSRQNVNLTTNLYDDSERIEELENAIIEYTRPGEKVNMAEPNTVSEMFDPFTRFVLRFVAISTNVPYSVLLGDYSGYNYTVLRGERQDFIKMRKPHQARLVRNFSAPATWAALDWAVMAGKIDLPGYELDPWRYRRGVWIPPGDEPIEPLRDAKANSDNLDRGLDSEVGILGRRGLDPEDVLDEIAEFRQMAEDRGIDLTTPATPLANNPASLMAMMEDLQDRKEMLNDES